MRYVVLLLVVVLGLTACGDDVGGGAGEGRGRGTAEEAGSDRPTSCPSYAAGAGDRFVVGFSTVSGLVDDQEARTALLDEVGERLCLDLTERDLLAPGAFLVGSDRPLDGAGQAAVAAALERADGVDYVVPDGLATPDAVPDGGSDR